MMRRMMIFIDGENLVARFQATLDEGRIKRHDVTHVRDAFVWAEGFADLIRTTEHDVLRATYYTSMVGGQNDLDALADQIKAHESLFGFGSNVECFLRPEVFKRDRTTRRSKGVDIRLTVDVLTQVHNDTVDTVYLMTGDGDYLPLVNEVQRRGKQVFVTAFSNGFNQTLARVADQVTFIERAAFFPQG